MPCRQTADDRALQSLAVEMEPHVITADFVLLNLCEFILRMIYFRNVVSGAFPVRRGHVAVLRGAVVHAAHGVRQVTEAAAAERKRRRRRRRERKRRK